MGLFNYIDKNKGPEKFILSELNDLPFSDQSVVNYIYKYLNNKYKYDLEDVVSLFRQIRNDGLTNIKSVIWRKPNKGIVFIPIKHNPKQRLNWLNAYGNKRLEELNHYDD